MIKNKAFTLLEIMVVVVLIGIIAAFAIPSYQNAVDRANTRKMILDAILIHSSLQIFKAKNGYYWPLTGTTVIYFDSQINAALGLNLSLPPDVNAAYMCYGFATGTATKCQLASTAANIVISAEVVINSTNPSCVSAPTYDVCP